MYTLDQLKLDRELWKNLEIIPIQCSVCEKEFETKYGTLYNVIRRNAEGIYCDRKCAAIARIKSTQERYKNAGGKICKRCGEFLNLENFSPLPNPPYFRAECRRCHNYKPARQFSSLKEKASRSKIEFNLSLDQFLQYNERHCFYCHDELKNIRLEMIESSKGFSADNVVACCAVCQKFKSDLEHQKFIQLCLKISQNLKKSEE